MDILFPDCCLFLFFLLVSLDLGVNRLDRLTSGLMIAALSRTLYSLFFFIINVFNHMESQRDHGMPRAWTRFIPTERPVPPSLSSCDTIQRPTPRSFLLALSLEERIRSECILSGSDTPSPTTPLYHNKEIWGQSNGKGGIKEEMEKVAVQKLLEQTELEDENDNALAAASFSSSSSNSTSSSVVGEVHVQQQHQQAEFLQDLWIGFQSGPGARREDHVSSCVEISIQRMVFRDWAPRLGQGRHPI